MEADVVWTDLVVQVPGARISVQVSPGPGTPTLVLVAGLGCSRDWWSDGLCARLVAAGLRVVRYDHRDTGESTTYPVGEPGYTSADLVADAVAVVEASSANGRAVLVGHSMGAGLAQAVAAQAPERVESLVLLSCSPADDVERDLPPPTPELMASFEAPPPDPDWADRDAVVEHVVALERQYAGPGRLDADLVRAAAARTWERGTSPASAANHEIVVQAGDAVDLAAVRAPTLVVHGAADPLFPLPHGEAFAEALDASLLVLDGVGHQLPPRDTWDELVRAVVAHVRPVEV